jgi:hypothetical protein
LNRFLEDKVIRYKGKIINIVRYRKTNGGNDSKTDREKKEMLRERANGNLFNFEVKYVCLTNGYYPHIDQQSSPECLTISYWEG